MAVAVVPLGLVRSVGTGCLWPRLFSLHVVPRGKGFGHDLRAVFPGAAAAGRQRFVHGSGHRGAECQLTAAGAGYALRSGIPLAEGLIKNRYVGRTFIEPHQRIRDLGVKLKFNPLPQVLNGNRIVLVDDSIVRGTTTPQVIRLLRKAGAKEVHMRICAPPIRYPCFFGVDMATRWELIAAQKTIPKVRDFIGADSLGYLSVDGLIKAVALPKDIFCLACFTGDYPIPVQIEMDKLALETMPVGQQTAFGIKQR